MSTMAGVLASIGVDVAMVGEREISAHCPFHKDANPSFSMNAETGLWICYQCSERGNLEMLVEKIPGAVSGQAVAEIIRDIKRASIGKKLSPVEAAPDPARDPHRLLAEYESFKVLPEWACEDRFLTPEAADTYGIRWHKGYVIPIWSPERELWGWQFKVLQFVSNYPPAIKKSHSLFGLKEFTGGRVVLVESPLDVVRLASAGVQAVSTYGAYASKEQLRLLVENADSVTLALDADKEGRKQTAAIYPRVARYVPTRVATMPWGAKDPGDLTDSQVHKVFG